MVFFRASFNEAQKLLLWIINVFHFICCHFVSFLLTFVRSKSKLNETIVLQLHDSASFCEREIHLWFNKILVQQLISCSDFPSSCVYRNFDLCALNYFQTEFSGYWTLLNWTGKEYKENKRFFVVEIEQPFLPFAFQFHCSLYCFSRALASFFSPS